MGGPRASSKASGSATAFLDLDTMQRQLMDLANDDDEGGFTAMINLINESKKAKLTPDDKTVINIASIMVPFVLTNKTVAENVKKLQVAVEKNKTNLRMLAYRNERLEQYTRRDNLRLFNFPIIESEDELRNKFIELGAVLGVTIQGTDINTIHKLPTTHAAQSMPVIVRLNNRRIRNDLLYAKKAPLNTPDNPFRGVFIQEDLTQQRSKLLRFVKAHANTERTRTSEGRIRVTLKDDRGAGRNVIIENPDDLFKIGVDNFDITSFGFPDM